MSRFISPITDLKPNGTVWFFESSTNVPKLTYKDELETIKNIHGVVVLPNGNLTNIFYSGVARVLFLDEFGVQYAERDPVGASSGGGGFSLWSSVVTYPLDWYVQGSDGNTYKSLIASNTGNDPLTSSTRWEQVNFIGVWDTSITYAIGNVVQTVSGSLWRAVTAAAGNDPEVDTGTNWLPAVSGVKIPEIIELAVLNSWEIPEVADFTGANNEARQIDASANTVDVTLPVLVAGDSFTYHNLITSTFKVQILNPIETIKGTEGTIAAATNLEIEPGQTVQMIAVSATILSVVGALL